MFKRLSALILALCLLLTSSSIAFMEGINEEEFFAASEFSSEAEEAIIGEDADLDLIDSEDAAEADVALDVEDEAPVEDAVPEFEIDEADAANEAPVEEVVETPADEVAETPVEEASDNNEVEAPLEQAKEAVVVEAPAESAKLAAAAAAPAAYVLTKNAKYSINKGTTLQINLSGQTATKFTSSKKKVATVSATGLVTAKAAGKTKIVATITKKKKLTLTLTVVDPTIPTSVYITKGGAKVSGTITANKGQPITLVPVAVAPGTASTGFKYTSSKKKIATISKKGVLTPKKVGTTTITVTTTRGKKKAKLKVKVADPYKATAVSLDKTGLLLLTVKNKLTLKATMKPANSTSTLKWSTSNKKVATVSKNGVVTGKKTGTAKITVKTSSGKKASVKIKVLKKPGATKGMIPEWSAMDEDNTLDLGETKTYVVSMNPVNAKANVVWTSLDPTVVQVKRYYQSGDLTYIAEVYGKDLGYTYITAKDKVSGYQQSVKVLVIPPVEPESITFPELKNDQFTMQKGKKADVLYQVNPQTSLSHSSNCAVVEYDTSICTIEYEKKNAYKNCRGTMDYYLHITAKKAGTTKVKVYLKGKPSVTRTFTLTVTN